MRRSRRPASLVWLVAIPFAILIGLAIAGTPFVAKDIPLKERGVTAGPAATPVAPTTTTTAAG